MNNSIFFSHYIFPLLDLTLLRLANIKQNISTEIRMNVTWSIPVIEQSKSKAETKYAAPGTDVVFVTWKKAAQVSPIKLTNV